MKRIILASSSAQRKEIMDSLNVHYKIIPSSIDEKAIRDENLVLRAERIARAKAEKVFKENKDAIIIAADTFNAIGEFVLEKPNDLHEAREMLLLQSGKTARTFTGFCYIDQEAGIDTSKTVVMTYTFRGLLKQEIDNYVAHNPVTTWSAAFAPANVKGLALISSMSGSLTGFTHGLPVEDLIPLLRKSGVEV